MNKNTRFKPIIITFRTPNGSEWNEMYTSRLIDIFTKDPTVIEIKEEETDKLIYKKEGK